MKEQTLLEMKNKVEALTRVLQQLITENTHLRELGVGTLETLKLMPNYQEALDELKDNMIKKTEEKKNAQKNGVDESNVKK